MSIGACNRMLHAPFTSLDLGFDRVGRSHNLTSGVMLWGAVKQYCGGQEYREFLQQYGNFGLFGTFSVFPAPYASARYNDYVLLQAASSKSIYPSPHTHTCYMAPTHTTPCEK